MDQSDFDAVIIATGCDHALQVVGSAWAAPAVNTNDGVTATQDVDGNLDIVVTGAKFTVEIIVSPTFPV